MPPRKQLRGPLRTRAVRAQKQLPFRHVGVLGAGIAHRVKDLGARWNPTEASHHQGRAVDAEALVLRFSTGCQESQRAPPLGGGRPAARPRQDEAPRAARASSNDCRLRLEALATLQPGGLRHELFRLSRERGRALLGRRLAALEALCLGSEVIPLTRERGRVASAMMVRCGSS